MTIREQTATLLTSDTLLCDRYRVLRPLGQGGFSQTYEVEDCADCDRGNTKVLKVLLESYPKAVDLFQREAKVLSQLSHPGIPTVEADAYFTFQATHAADLTHAPQLMHGLVMEKIPGMDLQQWMASRNMSPISQPQAINWLQQLAEILGLIHDQQYFHRDIKPSNIMLKPDGQLVLIDFGGVREITETFLRQQEDDFTGTRLASRGYAPLEQVDGRAVPQSDFFALGRTFVYLLTGKSPTTLPSNAETGQLLWQDHAPLLSRSLIDLIDWLMAPFPGQRPQSADDILDALDTIAKLDATSELPQRPKTPPYRPTSDATQPPWSAVDQLSSVAPNTQFPVPSLPLWLKLLMMAGWSSAAAALLIGARLMGLLQPLELAAFDQFLRWRPTEPNAEHTVVLEVTQADIRELGGEYPLHDDTLLETLQALEAHSPHMIGIDIYRDRPEGEGQAELISYIQQHENVVPICAHPMNADDEGTASLAGIAPEQVGFADIALDLDETVRRHLLAMPPQENFLCQASYAISTLLAFTYLEQQGYELFPGLDTWQVERPDEQGHGALTIHLLRSRPGFYADRQSVEGHQILLNYRAVSNLSEAIPHVTLSDLRAGTVEPDLIRDKVVIIGVTDPTVNDDFRTPYAQNIRGVLLQAELANQLIAAVEENRPLLQFWPRWADWVWIAAWAGVGGGLWLCKTRSQLALSATGTVVLLSGLSWFSLISIGVVVPVVPATLALGLALSGRLILKAARPYQ